MFSAFCRVCLASNVKIYDIANKRLQEIYEKLSGNKLSRQNKKSFKICYLCYSQLEKSRKFSDLSSKSAKILSSLLSNGITVTHETIATLNLGKVQTLLAVTLPSTFLKPEEIMKVTPELIAMLRQRKLQKLRIVTMQQTSLDGEDFKNDVEEVGDKQEPIEIESSNDEEDEDDKIFLEDLAKFLIKQVNTEPPDTANELIEPIVKTDQPINTLEITMNVKNEPIESNQLHAIKDETTLFLTENPTAISVSNNKCKTEVNEDEKNNDFEFSILTDDQREAKIVQTLQGLSDVIEECKPAMYSNYNKECDSIREYMQKIKSDGTWTGQKRFPKRRFPWCPRSRALLHRLVKLAGSEQAGALLLVRRALPLFPPNFVRIPTLMKQANIRKYASLKGIKRRLDSNSERSQGSNEHETEESSHNSVDSDTLVKVENKNKANELLVETQNCTSAKIVSTNTSKRRKNKPT